VDCKKITTSEETVDIPCREKSTPVGHSVGSEFTLSSQSSSISASLNDIPLYGLVNNGFPRAEYSPSSHPANTGVDGTAPDSAWHYLLFDGGNCTLAHWNTTTLDGLPFTQKLIIRNGLVFPAIEGLLNLGHQQEICISLLLEQIS